VEEHVFLLYKMFLLQLMVLVVLEGFLSAVVFLQPLLSS